MTEKALTRTTEVIDGAHPARSVLRLLARRPGRMALAVFAFALKEVPLWFLPVVTASIPYLRTAPVNYLIGSAFVQDGDVDVDIRLDVLPAADDPTYVPADSSACGRC